MPSCDAFLDGYCGLVQLLEEFSLQICYRNSGGSLFTLLMIVIDKLDFGLQGRCEQGGDGEGVEQDQLVANFEALS